MYNMISRNLTLPYKFYCLTEDPTDLNENINVIPLPTEHKLEGWWWKTYMFKQGLFEGDINFYIDLDMIVMSNIDHYMTYEPNLFLGLRDVSYVRIETLNTLGSGIMRWPNNTYSDIWDTMTVRGSNVMATYRKSGDQAYIWDKHKTDIYFFPVEWYESYHWEYQVSGHKDTSSILVFHGFGKPHNCHTSVVEEYWK
jgi:hypothetical protein